MSTTDGSSVIAIPFSISGLRWIYQETREFSVNTTTDGTSVKYDPVRPTLSNIVMVSNNSNNAYAKLEMKLSLL